MTSPFREPPEPGAEPPEPAASEAPEEKPERRTALDTAVLPRNFTQTSGERIRAIVSGPPAYMRRLRLIEDMEAQIMLDLARAAEAAPKEAARLRRRVEPRLATLRNLVVDHNRYYPIEANLPMDLRSGVMLDRGAPWRPRPLPTIESLSPPARSR